MCGNREQLYGMIGDEERGKQGYERKRASGMLIVWGKKKLYVKLIETDFCPFISIASLSFMSLSFR